MATLTLPVSGKFVFVKQILFPPATFVMTWSFTAFMYTLREWTTQLRTLETPCTVRSQSEQADYETLVWNYIAG